MQTSFIEIDNLTIAYIEKNPEASNTIFFIHGNSVSKNCWRKQFETNVLDDFRLIAFDLPGHGNSSSLNDVENYNLLFLGELMAKAINAFVNSNQFILSGFSFGANVVAEILDYVQPAKGIVLISPTIVGGDYTLNKTLKEGADASILFTDEPDKNRVTDYIHKALLSDNPTDFFICEEDFLKVKKPFRSMILKTSIEGKLSNEILKLQQINIPLLIIFGEQDYYINPDYLNNAKLPLWNHEIYKINKAGHFLNLDQFKIFNDLLYAYCVEMFK